MKKTNPTTSNMNPDHQIIPFPGLRPFRIEESHLFFGREGQSEDVLAKLAKNKFVAVIGASGSGKSSLMYCGLVPILYGGFITEAGSRWRIVTTRPGNSPVENLAHALQKSRRTAHYSNTLFFSLWAKSGNFRECTCL